MDSEELCSSIEKFDYVINKLRLGVLGLNRMKIQKECFCGRYFSYFQIFFKLQSVFIFIVD